MIRPLYWDFKDRILGKNERFRQDPQLRGIYRRFLRAWDLAAVYLHARTYLGEVTAQHPTSLDVRLWRDEHSEEFPRIKDGEVRSFGRREQLKPISATDLGTIVQYDTVEIRNFGSSKLRRLGQLEAAEGKNYVWGPVEAKGDGFFNIRLFPSGGITVFGLQPRNLIVDANSAYPNGTLRDVVQIAYDQKFDLDHVARMVERGASEGIEIARIGFVNKPFSLLTDATIGRLSYKGPEK